MDKKNAFYRYNALSEVFKAIAHPTRLLIIEELSKKQRCVSELTDMIGADTSTVSKHLAVMKNAGLVGCDKLGNQVFYSLLVPCVLQFIGCIESVIRQGAEQRLMVGSKNT